MIKTFFKESSPYKFEFVFLFKAVYGKSLQLSPGGAVLQHWLTAACCMMVEASLCWSGLCQLSPRQPRHRSHHLTLSQSLPALHCSHPVYVDHLRYLSFFQIMYYYLIRVPEKLLVLCVLLYAIMLCGGLYLTLNWFLGDHIKAIK